MTAWPDLSPDRFSTTGHALHMWLQIVGKLRIRLEPWLNHAWHATFYPNARGLTSGLMHHGGRGLEATFDLLAHELILQSTDGAETGVPLTTRSVADFHAEVIEMLARLDAPTDMHGAPNEIPDALPFDRQTETLVYDPAAATDFWRALVAITAVFQRFRTAYLGKATPPHLFWGSFDLAITRFSGRAAPLHPGGIPALPDEITQEAYSHEVSSAGFWPGGIGGGAPMFYSYAYPTPAGFGRARVLPQAARFDEELGEFVLPYEVVRRSPDPAGTLLDFLHTTYVAAADLGRWDRERLECSIGQPGRPRQI